MGISLALDALDAFRDDAANGAGKTGKLARSVCDAYAGNPAAGKAVDVAYNGYDAPLQYGCGPYWNGPDGYDAPVSASEELPFEGGQCPGVPYTVFRTRTSTSTGQPIENDVGDYDGPVTISTPENPLNQGGDPLENLWVYTINEGRPDEQVFQTGSDGPPSFRLERTDGLPDECGNPDPVRVPSQPGAPPSGTGFGDPRDIGEPGDPFIVTPQPPDFSKPGEPVIVFDSPAGPIPVSPSDPDPGLPSGEPSLGPPQDVSGAGDLDAEPEDEATESTLLGYRVVVRDDTPQFQSVIPGTEPRVYSRVVGSVQLKMRGDSGTFFSDNLQLTSQEASIVKTHPTLQVVGCSYNVLPNLAGLTLYEIRGKDDDS